jgi:hypothetical protein
MRTRLLGPGILALVILLSSGVKTGDAATTQYTYDAMDRLTMVQYDNGATVVYTYDKMGNRLTMQVTPPTQAPGAILTPLTSPGDATVQEVAGPSSSSAAVSPATGLPSLPGLQVYIERLPQVNSVADADKLRQEVFDYLNTSSLSPADKASYQQQFSRSLQQQMESLTTKAEAGAPSTAEEPAPAAAAFTQKKAVKDKAPVQKNKIQMDHGKIYTLPPAKDE